MMLRARSVSLATALVLALPAGVEAADPLPNEVRTAETLEKRAIVEANRASSSARSPGSTTATANGGHLRFADDWRIAEAFVYPDELVDRFEELSNSGGSWGPDGHLYITGHDLGKAYAMLLPEAGSVMRWVDTVTLDVRGQCIAWDRSAEEPTLYGIIRSEDDEENFVTVHCVPLREQRAAAP